MEPDVFLDSALAVLKNENEFDLENLNITLLFIPFYRLSFTYGTEQFVAFISAHKARVLYNELPGGSSLVLDSSFAITATTVLSFYTVLTLCLILATKRVSIALLGCFGLTFFLYKWISKILLR